MLQSYAPGQDFPGNALVPHRLTPITKRYSTLDGIVRANLKALGECPSFAPYESPGGGCSNIPQEVDAFEYFKSGGTLTDEGVFDYDTSGFATQDCPYGSERNPVSGAIECVSSMEKKYTTGSGYVVRSSSDPATMTAIAAEAERQGRAKGVNISCHMVPMGGDPITHEQRYGTDCTVNGQPGHDAAVILTGGGLETAVIETGGTMKQALQLTAPTGPVAPSWWQPGGSTPTPPTYATQQQATAATGKPNASATTTVQPGVVPVQRVQSVADRVAGSFSLDTGASGGEATDEGILGMPTNTVLLIGAALAAVMLMSRK